MLSQGPLSLILPLQSPDLGRLRIVGALLGQLYTHAVLHSCQHSRTIWASLLLRASRRRSDSLTIFNPPSLPNHPCHILSLFFLGSYSLTFFYLIFLICLLDHSTFPRKNSQFSRKSLLLERRKRLLVLFRRKWSHKQHGRCIFICT